MASSNATMLRAPARVKADRRRRLTGLYTRPGSVTRLQRTAQLAAREVNFPMAQVNVLDDEYLYNLAQHDDDGVLTRHGQAVLPIAETMCRVLVESGKSLAVDDLMADPQYACLPGVRAGMAGSYLGVPLRSRESDVIGSLCVIDRAARHISPAQTDRLTEFAEIVEDQLDLIRRRCERESLPAPAAADLARAVDVGEIVPWYQPIVDLETGRASAVEALARWAHPDGGIEGPARFLPGAEDSHLVVDIDLAIMRQAVADLARWSDAGSTISVNVNLTPLHLEIDGGVAAIKAIVSESGVDPSRVTLELTESHRLENVTRAGCAVGELRDFGFPVVLDDFGTGWSSLDWIMGLPVTGLKVDRSVTNALDTRAGRAVTRAATGLARDLDLSLTLEGIETSAQLAMACANGYLLGQGFFWSPPVPAVTIEARIGA